MTWRYDENGKKVKTTRRIRFTTHREVVNPRVAERKTWAKFGLSGKDGKGPAAGLPPPILLCARERASRITLTVETFARRYDLRW